MTNSDGSIGDHYGGPMYDTAEIRFLLAWVVWYGEQHQ